MVDTICKNWGDLLKVLSGINSSSQHKKSFGPCLAERVVQWIETPKQRQPVTCETLPDVNRSHNGKPMPRWCTTSCCINAAVNKYIIQNGKTGAAVECRSAGNVDSTRLPGRSQFRKSIEICVNSQILVASESGFQD